MEVTPFFTKCLSTDLWRLYVQIEVSFAFKIWLSPTNGDRRGRWELQSSFCQPKCPGGPFCCFLHPITRIESAPKESVRRLYETILHAWEKVQCILRFPRDQRSWKPLDRFLTIRRSVDKCKSCAESTWSQALQLAPLEKRAPPMEVRSWNDFRRHC